MRVGDVDLDVDPEAMMTGLDCACCGQEIEASEETVLLLIAEARQLRDEIHYLPVLSEAGDYLFKPLFVHLEACWKDIEEGIQEKTDDVPPVADQESILECSYCKSGIREWEYLVFGEYGEFYCSPHQPNNSRRPVYRFQPWGGNAASSIKICVPCLTHIYNEALDDWEDLAQFGECAICTQARCWRDRACTCFCHHER